MLYFFSQTQLYSGLSELYPEEFDTAPVTTQHSGKLFTLAQMLRSMHNAVPRQRVVVVSNYRQVLHTGENQLTVITLRLHQLIKTLGFVRSKLTIGHTTLCRLILNLLTVFQTLDVLEALCTSAGYPWLRLDGQTPTSKRQQLVERFNSPYSQDCKRSGILILMESLHWVELRQRLGPGHRGTIGPSAVLVQV